MVPERTRAFVVSLVLSLLLLGIIALPYLGWDEHAADLSPVYLSCTFIRGECRAEQDGMTWHLSLSPSHFPALERLSLSVQVPAQFRVQQLYFEGANMEMGRHFIQELKQRTANRYAGKGMIPVCSVDSEMAWQLVAVVEHDSGLLKVIWPLGPSVHEEK